MSENTDDKAKVEIDWSLYRKTIQSPKSSISDSPHLSGEVPGGDNVRGSSQNVLTPVESYLPEIETQEVGLLQRLRQNSITNDAARRNLKQILDAQSDHLADQLRVRLIAGKMENEVKLKEYLMRSNKYLQEIIATLGFDEQEMRMESRMKSQELMLSKIATVMSLTHWPDEAKLEVIRDITAIAKQGNSEIMASMEEFMTRQNRK